LCRIARFIDGRTVPEREIFIWLFNEEKFNSCKRILDSCRIGNGEFWV